MTQIELLLLDESDDYRHWHSGSEQITGGDSLATLLAHGWQIRPLVFEDVFYCSGLRPVHIYHFELIQDDETVAMSVQGNPYVERVIASNGLRVVLVDRARAPRIALNRMLKHAALEGQNPSERETTETEVVPVRVRAY